MTLLSLFLVIAASTPLFTAACPSYSSIFSFGDSLADTGNLYCSSSKPSNHCFFPPYGQTYFHHPSSRCSDGRLIIDFIAESLGIPMVKPYLGIKNGVLEDSATALEVSYFEERDVHNVATNYSLTVQMNWFKELLSALCNSSESGGGGRLLVIGGEDTQ